MFGPSQEELKKIVAQGIADAKSKEAQDLKDKNDLADLNKMLKDYTLGTGISYKRTYKNGYESDEKMSYVSFMKKKRTCHQSFGDYFDIQFLGEYGAKNALYLLKKFIEHSSIGKKAGRPKKK